MATNKSNEIQLKRIFDAPLKVVWDAWTDSKQVAQWWGPRGFTITEHSKDFRPGGQWHYTMHGADGIDYINKTKYLEIEKYARMVYDHGGNDEQKPLFRVTVNFCEIEGKTQMDMTMALETPEAAEVTRKFIKKAGGDTTWDRLAEYLAKQKGTETFVINRTFEASAETLFEMWTNPEDLSHWLAPTGMEMKFLKADIKPGGASFYCMTGNNLKMYGRASYLELTKPIRLAYTQQFCDEKNVKVLRHPLAPTWPETMLTTVQFNEEGSDRTRVTVTWEAQGATSKEELEMFIKSRGGMTQGWTGSFDKLEAYLAECI